MNRNKILLEFFEEVKPKYGTFQIDGKWYMPKFGSDTIQMVLDELNL